MDLQCFKCGHKHINLDDSKKKRVFICDQCVHVMDIIHPEFTKETIPHPESMRVPEMESSEPRTETIQIPNRLRKNRRNPADDLATFTAFTPSLVLILWILFHLLFA